MTSQALLGLTEESLGDRFSALGRVNILNGTGRMAFYFRAKKVKIIRERKPMQSCGVCWAFPLIARLRIKES